MLTVPASWVMLVWASDHVGQASAPRTRLHWPSRGPPPGQPLTISLSFAWLARKMDWSSRTRGRFSGRMRPHPRSSGWPMGIFLRSSIRRKALHQLDTTPKAAQSRPAQPARAVRDRFILAATRSKDDGHTWSPIRPIRLVSPGKKAVQGCRGSLLQMSDGSVRLYCVS